MANWNKILSRGNVEDRRGFGPTAIAGGGLGIGGIALIIILNLLGGGSVTDIINQIPLENIQVQNQSNYNAADFEGADTYEVFASTVLGSNNDLWETAFAQNNLTYQEPKLVLFRGSTQSSCGGASAESGPHYCPVDGTIYLDETFFDELTTRLGAQGGDVAEAYVIAHEVGHHVQNQLDTIDARDNASSIKQELQADCFAGLWAHSVKDLGIFEQNEINEAIDAAGAVGDDRIQKTTTGRVNPESWTHGSSEQRISAFNKGYASGQVNQCNF